MNTTSKVAIAAVALVVVVGAVGTKAFAHRYGGGYGGHHGGGYQDGGHGGGYYKRGRHHRWKHHAKKKRVRHLMERYDADGDKKVTQDEINSNREAWHKEFDTNNDGKLSLEEFKQLWLKAKARRIVRDFQRFDRDGDAALTVGEYLRPMEDLVERKDRNGDGAISRADMRRHHKHRDRMMHEDSGRDGGDSEPDSGNDN